MDDQVGLIDVIVIVVITFLVFWGLFGHKVISVLKRLKPAPCVLIQHRHDQIYCQTCKTGWRMDNPPVCKRMK